MNTVETTLGTEGILVRFNKLMKEVVDGPITRNSFRPWEIELVLDINECRLVGSKGQKTLHQYQRAVQRDMDGGASMPLTLSEYLRLKRYGHRVSRR